jgi:two-component system cell cycle sensor histidine kinase/response regulator CckA
MRSPTTSDQERLRLALLAADVGTWDWDLVDTSVQWNERHATIFGFPADTTSGSAELFFGRVHPEDAAGLEAALARARDAPGTDYVHRHRIVRANDGAVRWVEGRGCFFHDDAGLALRGTGVLRDVTEEVERAAELAAGEERFRIAVRGAGAGVWDFDLVRRVAVHDSAIEVLGYAQGELAPTLDARAALLHPDDLPQALRLLEDITTGASESIAATLRHRSKDGAYRWIALQGRVVARDPQGKATRIVGTSTDVTARQEAKRVRKEQSDLLETVLAHMPILVTLYAHHGRLLWANAEVVKVTGWTLEDLQREDWLSRMIPGEQQQAEVTAFMAEADGRTWKDVRVGTKDGETLETSWCNVRLSDGRLLGIGKDTSLDGRLRQAQKMESLGVLAGGIAHDFNNLLVGILGNASVAREDADPSSTLGQALSDIEAAARRAADLTRQLLAYAGKGRLVVEVIALAPLVREMSSLLASAISKKARLRVEIEEGLPAVRADATELRQVLMNLILNASDALGNGEGEIAVRVETRECSEEWLRRTVHADIPPGRYVFASVRDTGCGMSADVRARIFEPFFTTKFAGRGLGLASTLGIIRSHGGALAVTTELGRGSTFEMLLPALSAAVPSTEPQPAVKRVREPLAHETLLVVDDEAAVRSLVRRVLERHGFQVALAADGRKALRLFDEAAGAIHVVLLDLTMPLLSGEETLAALRAVAPDVKVVLMSDYDREDALARVGSVVAFVRKPFAPVDLVTAMRDVLAG